MFAEGKDRNAYDRAMLLTPLQDRTTGSCLHFWYFLYASSQNVRLNVFLKPANIYFWSTGGTFDNRWLYAQISVKSPTQPWQAVFQANVFTQNASSSVSIDDVSITRGLCPQPGDCTFEEDLCGWQNDDIDADMDWVIGQGVHSLDTGPQSGIIEIFIEFILIIDFVLHRSYNDNSTRTLFND